MASNDFFTLLEAHWALTVATCFLLYVSHACIRNYFFLRGFDGPFLARISETWFLRETHKDLTKIPLRQIHEKYGPVARIGPKSLSFATPEAARDIYYGVGRDWGRSEQYHVLATFSRGLVDEVMVSSTNKKWHDDLRRVMNPSFRGSWVAKYETIIDSQIDILIAQLQARFVGNPSGNVCNVYPWFTWFATDVISAIVYGKAYDDLVQGKDVHHILGGLNEDMQYVQKIVPMPMLDRFFRKNPIIGWLDKTGLRPNKSSHGAVVAQGLQDSRVQQHDGKEDAEKELDGPPILMDYFLQMKKEHPDIVTDLEILKFGLVVVFAGGDTTGITLTALLHYVLKSPSIRQKLIDEVDAHSQINNGRFSWTEAQKLPYLDACIRETFRMHPALRLTSTRVVPPGGATISGRFVPGGTIVGVNSWVVHTNKDVFGDDPFVFRPERWLEDDVKARRMYGALLHFSAGNFNCIGKNIASQEIYKVVPTLFATFDMKVKEPEADFQLAKGLLACPEKMEVKLAMRR